MNINPFLLTDFYKISHVFMYPPGTEYVYSNLTPRQSRLPGVDQMVFFGLQYFIKEYLMGQFTRNFFIQKKKRVIEEYRCRISSSLGGDLPTYKHLGDLHDLGYLPVKIKALPEGALVPMRVPCLTIVNTKPEFYWLTNFLETLMSVCLWQPCVSATIAYEYRKLLNRYAEETGMSQEFVQWQGHDFSFRGMSSLESAILSGMGHLLSFNGTDSIPAIDALEHYYNAREDNSFTPGSVNASEHSVMCAGEKDGELETFRRLICDVYPSGIISIVSDTWSLWDVLTVYLPVLKEEIVARDGKVVIRGDSGDPVLIMCGNPNGKTEPERKGIVELLWDVFGGTITSQGYKLLDEHVGAIYGDSINLSRAREICERLRAKGFASQVVYGIGSFTYQMNTRDTFGIAMKATSVVINGKRIDIFKDPITDDGMKKSAVGLLRVHKKDGRYWLEDKVRPVDEELGELKTVFQDGVLTRETSLKEIRQRLLG